MHVVHQAVVRPQRSYCGVRGKRADLAHGHRLRDHPKRRERLAAGHADCTQYVKMLVPQSVRRLECNDHHSGVGVVRESR